MRRANELHHIAMRHIVVQIRNLCMPRSYRFAEGASDEELLGGIERFHHPTLLITTQEQIP